MTFFNLYSLQITLFCALRILFNKYFGEDPQQISKYLRWGMMKLLLNTFFVMLFYKWEQLLIVPSIGEILPIIFCIWIFHGNLLFIYKPRYLWFPTSLILILSIQNCIYITFVFIYDHIYSFCCIYTKFDVTQPCIIYV